MEIEVKPNTKKVLVWYHTLVEYSENEPPKIIRSFHTPAKPSKKEQRKKLLKQIKVGSVQEV